MPIDAAHSLDEVLAAAVEHARATGLAPMWAVTPLAGVNDSDEDARALAAPRARVRGAHRRACRGCSSSRTTRSDEAIAFARSPRESRVSRRLLAAGLPVTAAISGGGDVAAACGQLAARDL